MRIIGGTGSTTVEAKAKEALRRVEEARQRAAERREAEVAKRQAAASDADKTGKGSKPSALALDPALKNPDKLAEAAQADPKKLAQAALAAPKALVEAAARNPAKISDAMLKGAGVVVGGVVGNELYQLVGSSLSVRGKVKQIKALTDKIQKAQADGASLSGATGKALEKAAKDAAKAPKLGELGKIGKLSASLSVISGANSALNLRHSVAALKDGATAKELATVAGDAFSTLRGVDDAVKLVKGANIGFLGGKINPMISVAASGADSIKRIDTLTRDWDKLSSKDKVANFAALGGNVCDIAGSGMVLSGVGAPIGVALKCVGAGLSLVSLGIQNVETLKKGAGKVGDVASDVATAGKKVLSALNPFD